MNSSPQPVRVYQTRGAQRQAPDMLIQATARRAAHATHTHTHTHHVRACRGGLPPFRGCGAHDNSLWRLSLRQISLDTVSSPSPIFSSALLQPMRLPGPCLLAWQTQSSSTRALLCAQCPAQPATVRQWHILSYVSGIYYHTSVVYTIILSYYRALLCAQCPAQPGSNARCRTRTSVVYTIIGWNG